MGVDDFMAYTRSTLGKPSQCTVHLVHAPEISLTSMTTARGVWAMNDLVRLLPAVTLHGYGHYHETYEKLDGQWRISSSRLTRLREDIALPGIRAVPQSVARRLRIAAAKLPATPPTIDIRSITTTERSSNAATFRTAGARHRREWGGGLPGGP